MLRGRALLSHYLSLHGKGMIFPLSKQSHAPASCVDILIFSFKVRYTANGLVVGMSASLRRCTGANNK